MYQRMLIIQVRLANAEQESHKQANDLICREEEDRRQRHHDENHDGGDGRLTARRPRNLVGFGAHFLQEFERAERHRYVIRIRRQTIE